MRGGKETPNSSIARVGGFSFDTIGIMETVITSAHNETVKQIKRLVSSAKARREEQLAVAEGAHLVQSFLHTTNVPHLYICAESALERAEVAALAVRLDGASVRRVVVADSLYESMSAIHASVGISLVFTPPDVSGDEVLTDTAVLLDEVQDPGNLGTILRVAAAAGVKHIWLSDGCASAWSPKALRAGMGAQFGLMIHEDVDLVALVDQAAVPVLVTTLSPKSESLYAIDLTHPVAWIVGNEGQGVRQELIEKATIHVSIPQADTPVESLNVAAATAVCLYEQFRQITTSTTR